MNVFRQLGACASAITPFIKAIKGRSAVVAGLCLLVPLLNANASPNLQNVSAERASGSTLVKLGFDLSLANPTASAIVSLQASRDGGTRFVTITNDSIRSGSAFGYHIASGNNKTINWNVAGSEFDTAPAVQVQLRATERLRSIAGMVFVDTGFLPDSSAFAGSRIDPFLMGKYEVTWGQWKQVRDEAASNGYDIATVGSGCADDHPVHSVNWFDALKWANAKSELEGLTPVYTLNGAIYKTGQPTHTSISQNPAANGYRLPTAAEWEFAARSASLGRGQLYAGGNVLNDVAWHWGNAEGAACDFWLGRGTWPVGTKNANALGLHDMSGNVWEWTWDAAGDRRVIRGGSWASQNSEDFQVSAAASSTPDNNGLDYDDAMGFRLVRNAVDGVDFRSVTQTIPVVGGDQKLWFEGSVDIGDGWRWFPWFKGFKPAGPWIYHGRHGWLYVVGENTSGLFLWDAALRRWIWTNEFVYPWMYFYGPNSGWYYFFEGGRPGSRWFRRAEDGNLIFENNLRIN